MTLGMKSPGGASNILYLTYDGLTDPLGRSQILPYLARLAGKGHRITIVSFEKPERSKEEWESVRLICEQAGIDWRPEQYHARPPVLSTVRDVRRMRKVAARLHRQRRFDIVHCRSYVTALVGLWLKRRFGIRFLFDMRGFYVDERIDMGLWRPGNPLYAMVIAFFRKREDDFFREADAIVSLTQAGADRLKKRTSRPVTVIPTCVDLDHFRLHSGKEKADARQALGIPFEAPVLAYLGSISERMLVTEMLEAFRLFAASRPGAIFLVVATQGERDLRAKASELGIDQETILFRPARREQVPATLAAADAGIAFYRPATSLAGCSPTKLGEMLAVGLPMLLNGGVGDVDRIMADAGPGVVAPSFDRASLSEGVAGLLRVDKAPEEIRAAARKWFDLDTGISAYDRLYRSLLGIGDGLEPLSQI